MPSPMDHAEDAILMEKTRISDGMGGWLTSWANGATFDASITLDSSMEARLAQRQGVIDIYTVVVYKNFPIEANDYFKRASDDQVFRVTSSPDENTTPAISSMDVKMFTAAKTTLPVS